MTWDGKERRIFFRVGWGGHDIITLRGRGHAFLLTCGIIAGLVVGMILCLVIPR